MRTERGGVADRDLRSEPGAPSVRAGEAGRIPRGRPPRLAPSLFGLVAGILAIGCGRFTPAEEVAPSEDLLSQAKVAIQALRERDYPRLYTLTSSAYRAGRSYEDFLSRNRAAETPYRLGPCILVQAESRIEAEFAILAFATSLVFPPEAETPEVPRTLLATFIREAGGWKLDDVATLSPLDPANPSAPTPGS